MHLVAIAELGGQLETPQLSALANDIGTTAYELRLLLNAGLPAVVLITADEAHAKAVAAAIARHKHVPVVCDRSRILPSGRMATLRNFELASTELIADRDSRGSCRYDDITVMLRAIHRSCREIVEQVKQRKFQPVMAVATGGMILSKKITKDVTTTTSSREQVLYLFRRGQEHPWILRERTANYAALGSAMGPSSFENFATSIARLRQLAPQAVYDERLTNSRPIRGIGDGSDAVDIQACLLADFLARPVSGVGG
jgi:hypothetical protein